MTELSDRLHEEPPPTRRGLAWRLLRGTLRWAVRVVAVLVLLVLGVAGYLWWTWPVPRPQTPIYQGVTYECRRLPTTPESSGLAHLITVDLSTPGLELYVTPVDPSARAAGAQYVTRWPAQVASEQGLSVLINASMFDSTGWPRRLPGGPARGIETLISEGQVNHVWEHTYLVWFEPDLTPHADDKPPRTEALTRAKWAVGGQGLALWNGKIALEPGDPPDRRTFVGIASEKKKLYLGVFDNVSVLVGAQIMKEMGAETACTMDGGTSTSLVMGSNVKNVRSGTYVYPLRGIATFLGVRAPPLK